MQRQRAHLEKLMSVLDTPLYTSRNWKDGKNFVPGKQRYVAKHDPTYKLVDHRSIGTNEIVLDYDAPSYAQNAQYALKISQFLKENQIPHYNYWSGNKGIHTHIFLDLNVPMTTSATDLIRKAIEKGFNLYKQTRIAFT